MPGNGQKWALFHSPSEIKEVFNPWEVLPVLDWAESCIRSGEYVIGFLSYEAAAVFDQAYPIKEAGGFPLLWLASYSKEPQDFTLPAESYVSEFSTLTPDIKRDDYIDSVNKIHEYIVDGDTYQVNFTFRSIGRAVKNPEELFLSLFKHHPVPYAAFINTGNFQIVSMSPELFLERNESGILHSLPMKGTAARGFTEEEDRFIAESLSGDPKNCAENVMIVDMVRNDFGRVCEPGSIGVNPLFHVDTYPTIHQMVSGVQGKLRANLRIADILSATFPAASITGAPKIRAMEIIAELEKSPRKIYTGTIGCFLPDASFCLNVAIRSIICSRDKTELGIGSGIVADSVAVKEWEECLLKSDFASFSMPDFEILETMLWERDRGFVFMEEHLQRAKSSQIYFGRVWNQKSVDRSIQELSFPKSADFARIRLRISQNGSAVAEFTVPDKKNWGKDGLRLLLSEEKTDSKDIFLYHKTTNRRFYNSKFIEAVSNGFDEIIFCNEKGQITEGAISNIFVKIDNKWLTPPVKSGLLPGIWRSKKIHELDAKEKILFREDILRAEDIIIGNSVRGTGKVERPISGGE